MRAEMADHHVPGAAIVVIADGEVTFAEGFGVADVRSKRAVSADTRFRVGSLMKMFTATAILTLAADETLDLHAPIRDYRTDLPPRLGALNVDQLLRHQGGLVDRLSEKAPGDEDAFLEPETIFSYSSLGYALAGESAARAARTPFESLVRDLVFEKYGMTATSFDADPQHDATPYRIRRTRAIPTNVMTAGQYQPAGFAWSTGNDLARFARAFMNGSLDPAVAAAMMTPRATVPGETRRYGYGALIDVQGTDTVIYHMGDERGGSAFLKMVPAKQSAVIVLTNVMTRLPKSMDTALALAADVASESRPANEGRPLEPAEVEALAGEYQNAFGLRIARKGRRAILGPPLPWWLGFLPLKREMLAYGDDAFGIIVPRGVSPEPIRIHAVRGDRGHVDYLFLRGRAYKRTK